MQGLPEKLISSLREADRKEGKKLQLNLFTNNHYFFNGNLFSGI